MVSFVRSLASLCLLSCYMIKTISANEDDSLEDGQSLYVFISASFDKPYEAVALQPDFLLLRAVLL